MLVGGILIGFVHLFAAVVAVGGSFFINAVLNKATKDISPPELGKLNQGIGKAFTPVVWSAIILILLTGLVRSAALGLLSTQVLLGSVYGNLLFAKMIILAIIIVFSIAIASSGMKIAKAAADTPPDVKIMQTAQAQIKLFSMISLVLGTVAILLAVTMRFIGPSY